MVNKRSKILSIMAATATGLAIIIHSYTTLLPGWNEKKQQDNFNKLTKEQQIIVLKADNAHMNKEDVQKQISQLTRFYETIKEIESKIKDSQDIINETSYGTYTDRKIMYENKAYLMYSIQQLDKYDKELPLFKKDIFEVTKPTKEIIKATLEDINQWEKSS